MSSQSVFVSLLIFLIVIENVFTWTIDLPEVRKYYFHKSKNNDKNYNTDNERIDFDNIHGDSPHNTHDYGKNDDYLKYYENSYHNQNKDKDYENEVYNSGKYADSFEYQSYMEKKVLDVVHNGSMYLEGLSRAIETYGQILQNCTKYNFTQPSPIVNTTWLPENESPLTPVNMTEREECERASRASEHVRRLAALALWTTRELQDRTYADDYEKRTHDEEEEENELLLRLAWFLDRLATLTGFDPQVDAATDPTRPPTTSRRPFSMMPVPDDVKTAMMECLRSNATEPAADRCQFPLPLPPAITQLFNITDDSPLSTTVDNTQDASTSAAADAAPTPSPPELLISSETRHLSDLTPVKSVKKRSIGDNPLLNVIKYYAKFKIWENSNPKSVNVQNSELFNVANGLTDIKSVEKRSTDKLTTVKKYSLESKKGKIHVPEDPMQYISYIAKHRKDVHCISNENDAEKLRLYLEKIRESEGLTDKTNGRKLDKTVKSVQKRSLKYENMFQPRVAQNPFQDISYYVKNKKGTEYQVNLVQAAEVRAGLEQIFQTGNIEVVRRFGSNYNPAVPNPLLAGALQSASDV